MLWYPAGSRDPDVNDNPETFDLTREESVHMAFGGGGRHFCLGAGLARLELRVTFEEVLRRMGDLRLAGEPQRLRSNWANGLTSLPIKFDPSNKELNTA
jgi:linalool 8-monooxygenase